MRDLYPSHSGINDPAVYPERPVTGLRKQLRNPEPRTQNPEHGAGQDTKLSLNPAAAPAARERQALGKRAPRDRPYHYNLL